MVNKCKPERAPQAATTEVSPCEATMADAPAARDAGFDFFNQLPPQAGITFGGGGGPPVALGRGAAAGATAFGNAPRAEPPAFGGGGPAFGRRS